MEEYNLSNILSMLDNPKEYNINTNLQAHEKDYLLRLFSNNNDIITELQILSKNIIYDNQLDYHIIPHIILCIIQIYQKYCYIFDNEFNFLNIIKFTSEIVIFTAIPSLDINEIIKINRAIDICINLVKLIPPFNYKKKCMNFFKSCICIKRNKSI